MNKFGKFEEQKRRKGSEMAARWVRGEWHEMRSEGQAGATGV